MKQPDFGNLLKQAQQMQNDMLKAQEELKSQIVEATVGGGTVSVKMTGDLELKEVKIDPQALDPEDPEMVQDMVLAAVNEAIRSAQELAASRMNQVAGGLGGLGLPGM
jgi:DNA-binding YbaB/EbfC family protein